MPEAARVRIGNSARGDRSRSTLQACLPERRPSIERDLAYVTDMGTDVKRPVAPTATMPCTQRNRPRALGMVSLGPMIKDALIGHAVFGT